MNKITIWSLIIIVLIIIAVGIYFWLNSNIINSTDMPKQFFGESIPQPPALPE